MPTEKKPDARRGEMAFFVAIILGLALGLFIKRVPLGLLLGIGLGLAIVFLRPKRSSRK